MSDDPVFVATFGCRNCGAEWDVELPPRTKVRCRRRAFYHDTDCPTMRPYKDCDCCEVVRCPTCDLLDDVSIEDTKPIEEAGA